MSWLRAWVAFWDTVEHPRTLGVVRILLALVMLFDFVEIWRLGLVTPLFSPQEAGGWFDVLSRTQVPRIYQLMPAESWVGVVHHALIVGLIVALLLGLCTRVSALLLVLLWAQLQHVAPLSDRAIDVLCRNALLILAFAGSGAWASIDAKLRTGRFLGDGAPVGAWARQLLVLQLVVMYFTAGVQKVGFLWLPWGGFMALYVILQDPAIARADFAWMARQPWLLATQIGTAVTMLWQWGYPLVLLWAWYKHTPERPGRLRAFANRWHLHLVWVVVGAIFHLLLAATMELGIFPWAMLALYPAFIHPDELARFGARLRSIATR